MEDNYDYEMELAVVSIIAKTLVENVSGIPMVLAIRYARKIMEELKNAGWLTKI